MHGQLNRAIVGNYVFAGDWETYVLFFVYDTDNIGHLLGKIIYNRFMDIVCCTVLFLETCALRLY